MKSAFTLILSTVCVCVCVCVCVSLTHLEESILSSAVEQEEMSLIKLIQT